MEIDGKNWFYQPNTTKERLSQECSKSRFFKKGRSPSNKKKSKIENRLIAFQDEAAIRLLPCVSKTYAPKGATPFIPCDSKNKAYVTISGIITPEGKSYFEVRELEGFKQKGLTRFLNNARKKIRMNLILIWDNAPSHKSQTVKEYLAQQDKQNPAIWMTNITPYSPELNPIEQVWGYLKKKLENRFFKTTKELKLAVLEQIEYIKADKKLIKQFFKNSELECY